MNLFLHGARDFRIAQGDTLRQPAFLDAGKLRTFDCVLANRRSRSKPGELTPSQAIPGGRNIWGTLTDKTAADLIRLRHMVCSMDPKDGRCAVILPQGVLFHGGREGAIRKQLRAAACGACADRRTSCEGERYVVYG